MVQELKGASQYHQFRAFETRAMERHTMVPVSLDNESYFLIISSTQGIFKELASFLVS
jgi:hypothetical protein